MKLLKQFGIILLITLAAELLEYLIPLPVPASIYGLLLMLGLLLSGALKLERVEKAADFLVEIMPVMFIPAAVGLLDSYTALQGAVLPVVVIIAVTTVIVMAATGLVSQALIVRRHKKESGRKADADEKKAPGKEVHAAKRRNAAKSEGGNR